MIDAGEEEGFEWPTFTEAELADIISYVYYVKLFDEPGDPDLGERWFADKACAQCHTIGASTRAGTGLLPLDEYARYRSPVMLAQGMWNHGPTMRATQAVRGIALPALAGTETADLLAYIRRHSQMRDRDVVLLEPPDPNEGQRLFRSKGCSRCHGISGRGSSFAPDLHRTIPRLQAAEIAGQLWNHSATMASAMAARGISIPRFGGNEMADVIAYLYYLRFYETGGDVDEGMSVFLRKGCSSCHATAGEPVIGPDLSQSGVTQTLLGLATAMWNHAPGMYALLEPGTMNDWPRFEGDEMANLAAYLRSVAAAAGPPP
jgi:cytochrome c2